MSGINTSCEYGVGKSDWLDDGCAISNISDDAINGLYIVCMVSYLVVGLYVVYRLIGMARIACYQWRHLLLQKAAAAAAATAQSSPPLQHHTNAFVGGPTTNGNDAGGAAAAATVAIRLPPLSTSSTRSSVDLTTLRLSAAMLVIVLVGCCSASVGSILHLQGQRLSVDFGVTFAFSVQWACAWWVGHLFMRYLIRSQLIQREIEDAICMLDG
jgi:hypothetical protein